MRAQEACSQFEDSFYHEGIEYIPSKGLIVGRVGGGGNAGDNTITIVNADGDLTPWTTEPPSSNQQYQLGLEVDMDRDRLIATNMNSAPRADGVTGVLVLQISTGKELFYWDGTIIANDLTPNDVTVCPNGKIYATDHVYGHIVEIESASKWRKVTQIKENKFEEPLGTKAHLTNGIVCISNDMLLVGFLTPPKEEGKKAVKGKLLRVNIKTGNYQEVPLPDVDGVGDYVRMDGVYKEDATSLWITTNSGNRRVLKIVATDSSWAQVKEVYASEPSACNTGPSTGVLVNGNKFYMTGSQLTSIFANTMKKVWNEVCSPFEDSFYHEGIEYIPSKGLIVGRTNENSASGRGGNAGDNTITIVNADGDLTPWTTEPPSSNQQYQLGLEVDMDRDRLIATNMNSAPRADGVTGVLVLQISTGKELFYWDGTIIANDLTPNDVTVCPNGKIYATDHVYGHIVEIESASKWRKVTQIKENKFEEPLGTKAHLTNGIVCISNDMLLVGFLTPPKEEGKKAVKGKLLRVNIKTGNYQEVPLPDVDGVGDYVRMDGVYKEDATSLWITTNSGNRRVLKIVATDSSWAQVKEVYASEPSACNTGPSTGVLVNGNKFYMTGSQLTSIFANTIKIVWNEANTMKKKVWNEAEPWKYLYVLYIIASLIVLAGAYFAWTKHNKNATRESFLMNPSFVNPVAGMGKPSSERDTEAGNSYIPPATHYIELR